MNKRLKKIKEDVDNNYIFERYKAVCETIKSYELMLEFLETKEGRETNVLISGEGAVDNQLMKVKIVKDERMAERDFLENKLKRG